MIPLPPLPVPGQEDWGDDLNTYLVAVNAVLTELQGEHAVFDARVTALEQQPEYVFNSAPWQFSGNAPPATGNQLRLDNTNPGLAALIDVRKIDSEGADRSPWLQMIASGSVIQISDWDDSTVYHRYQATGPATFDATNVQIPVTWITGLGTLPNAKANVGFLVDVSPLFRSSP